MQIGENRDATSIMEDLNADDTPQTGPHTPPIQIRAAEPGDVPHVSRILAEAFAAMYVWIFGRLSMPQTANLLCALYQAGTLSLNTTRLAARDSQVIGVAILHVGESIGKGTFHTYWQVTREHLGFWKGLRAFFGGVFANFAIARRIPKGKDLVYIEALAVDAPERGRGVGKLLLEDALQWSQARGRERMALHVLQSNANARRLYERMGFRLHSPEPRPKPIGSRPRWVSLLMFRDPQ